MSPTAQELRRGGIRDTQKTAFERTLLPGFAAWLIDQIARLKPDYIIPIETKGARLLDVALAYAREELGAEFRTPVIYASALDYISVERLAESRVLIVDDVVRTGANMERHRDEIKARRVCDIKALACIGSSKDGTPQGGEVDCFLRVEDERFSQYLWQLTELVVSPGLPPEVDHFMFELRPAQRFAPGWRRLQAALAVYGQLTIDGPRARGEQPLPMTLHFPRLPGMSEREDAPSGPHKLRLFPDPDGKRVLVVPMSLPSVRIDSDERTVPLDRALSTLQAAAGPSQIGELLLAEAQTIDPRTVFRAVSAVREMEMVGSLASLLASEFGWRDLRLHRRVLGRLYGERLATRLAQLIEAAMAGALEQPPNRRDTARAGELAVGAEETYLDNRVVQSTREMAVELKRLYDVASQDRGEPDGRIGLPMPELAESANRTPLLTSRCLDFGCALTAFVPYIDVIEVDGSLEVQRRYRVSESNRRDSSYRDIEMVRQETSEQAVAVICKRLGESCERYREAPIPLRCVVQMIAILRPLVFEAESLTLKAIPGASGLRGILLDTVEPIAVEQASSAYYKIGTGNCVETTAHFESCYQQSLLDLDLDGCTESIERHVDELARFIDDLEEAELDELFDGWTMSSDMRLGLSHVRAPLAEALAQLRLPLCLMLRGERHERTAALREEADKRIERAEGILALLRRDWSVPAQERWRHGAGRREQRLRSSLRVSADAAPVYEFAETLTRAVAALARTIDGLDAASAEHWRDGNSEASARAAGASARAATIQDALRSLAGGGPVQRPVRQDARAAITAAAEDLLDTVGLIASALAAVAGASRVAEGEHRRARHPEARQVTVLVLDIAGSTVHGEAREERSHNRWVNKGLGLVAQWTRTFGGWERLERKGDELISEFEHDGDAPVMAAAAVLCHARALRGMQIDEASWRFHCGIDHGEIKDEDNNVLGRCINGAATIGKRGDGKTEASKIVISSRTLPHCSSQLAEQPYASPQASTVVGEYEGREIQIPVSAIDSAQVFAAMSARLREACERVAAELDASGEIELPLQIEPEPAAGEPEQQTG